MTRQKELDEDTIDAARARVLLDWDPMSRKVSAATMGKKIGITGQALLNLVHESKAGEYVVSKLEAYFGEKRSAWLKLARDGTQPNASAPQETREVVREERYPTMARAFEYARATQMVDEKILDIVRADVGLHKGDGPTEDEVLKAIRAALVKRDKVRAFLAGEVEELDRKPELPKRRTT